jgi:hypothetical protein
MLNNKTEIFFPARLIPELRSLRGESWAELVDRVASLPQNDPARLAFLLLLIRLGGCHTCHADAYWAMQGCARCSRNTITRFRGSDDELLARYETAYQEILDYVQAPAEAG